MDWWLDGVIYQLYPRSFADANGDGVGDLQGITRHLDHLAWLGVDAIWLNPITVSPNADWGYDVADYCDVDPSLGTLGRPRRAGRRSRPARGIRIVLDIVPNHTSRPAPVVRRFPLVPGLQLTATGTCGPTAIPPGRPDAAPPEQLAERLRWTGVDVRRRRPASGTCTTSSPSSRTSTGGTKGWSSEFDRILRFWFDRGVAGFRIDVATLS